MTTRIAAVLLLGALALAPGLAIADESHSLEAAVVESATTSAEHTALAAHFRGKAAGARAEASQHDAMARAYAPPGGGKTTWGTIQQRQKMADHCKRLSQQNAAMAQDFDALAQLHDEQAKGQ